MAFVVDTNFFLTLRDINQLNAISRLKKDLLVPRSVKGELINVDLEPYIRAKKVIVVDSTDPEITTFIQSLASKSNVNTIIFAVELQGLMKKITLPDKWKTIDELIVKGASGKVFSLTQVITNDQSLVNILEKTDRVSILNHADVHVCVVYSRKADYYVMTMDAGIWAALYTLNSGPRIMPIFSCLKLLFKDEPQVFIDSLTQIIATKRYKFAKDIVDSSASRICFDDLEKSVEDVLTRQIMEFSDITKWSNPDLFLDLIRIKARVRQMIHQSTKINGTLEFDDDKFIKELSGIRESLNTIQVQIKQMRD